MRIDDPQSVDEASPAAPRGGGALGPALVVAVAVAIFAFLLWRVAPPAAPDFGDAVHYLAVPLDVPELELVDHTGAPFTLEDLRGRWSLLFFGYTYCPDICPVTLQSLVPVQALLGEADATRIVFVSVDPARDDVARMAEYVAFFDPAYVGVTGHADQITVLTHAVGAYNAARPAEPGAEGYLVDHASSLFLVGPEAKLEAILHEPKDAAEFVALLRRIRETERAS